jgi:hypothetical protein
MITALEGRVNDPLLFADATEVLEWPGIAFMRSCETCSYFFTAQRCNEALIMSSALNQRSSETCTFVLVI